MRFYIGLDLSFRSPGCAIYDAELDKWYVFGFATRVRERGYFYNKSNVFVRLLPPMPEEGGDVAVYMHIEQHLSKVICDIVPQSYRATECAVRLEAYAYADRKKSGYDFKLHELGGIMKRQLCLLGFQQVDSIVQSSWKAHVVGRGDAQKIHVVHHVKENAPFLDVLAMLGFCEDKLPLNDKGFRKVPTPCQDWADSICIAKSLFVPPAKKKTPKSKRKTQIDHGTLSEKKPRAKKGTLTPKTIQEALEVLPTTTTSILSAFVPRKSNVHQLDEDDLL